MDKEKQKPAENLHPIFKEIIEIFATPVYYEEYDSDFNEVYPTDTHSNDNI